MTTTAEAPTPGVTRTELPHVLSEARAGAVARVAGGVDLVVIGAGINGAGVAWDAALRGLRVLLLDKGDIGSGTSSWSSRLIHGGLKYLEKYDVPLVRESLREREWLLQAAPHLVTPLRFVLPFYERNAHPALTLRAGMVAYDALSWDKSLPWHREHTAAGLARRYPGLDTEGLQGGATYSDGQVQLAERLVVEVALAARAAGAVVLPHAEVVGIRAEAGRLTAVEFVDGLTGQRCTVPAAAAVNVAGPWVDEVLTGSGVDGPRLIGGTKGSHYVVDPFPGAPGDAMYFEAISDGRPLMVLPWQGRFIIGSTDLRFSGDLDTVRSDAGELGYVLREVNLVLPRASLTPESVLLSYSGVRPLPYDADKPEGDITRRHVIVASNRVEGLLNVVGGKLTTFRALAQDAVDEVVPLTRLADGAGGAGRVSRTRRRWGNRLGLRRSLTRQLRLPGGAVGGRAAFADAFAASSALPETSARRLVELYGSRAGDVEALTRVTPALAEVVNPATGTIAAQVVFAVREELADTLGDVLARRTMDGLEPDLGLDSADAVGRVLVDHLGWTPQRVAAERADYERYVERLRP